MKLHWKKKTLAAVIAAASQMPAMAEQQVDSAAVADKKVIETIVVVGEATNALVTAAELEAYQANDLADVFRHTPSISVGGSLGIAQKVYVRGLEDKYVNVTVDGAPQASTLFHHIGRVNIDPALLKEVEVQAGAGEATSGAGAIGGAIRFRTQDVDDLLAADESFGGNVKGNYFSNDGEQYSATLYGRLNENWGVLAYYNDTQRDNFDDGDGDEVLATASDQNLAFFKISGTISDNQTLSLSYEGRDEEADFSARPNWHVPVGTTLYASEAKRDTYIANYTLQQSELLNLEVTLYDTEQSYNGGAYDWLAEISTVGLDVRNASQFGNHTITYGVDYRKDEVTSDGVWAGTRYQAEEEGSVFGAYAQVHSQLTDQLLLSYGARYDDYENEQVPVAGQTTEPSKFDESDVSFNAGLSYQLTDAWVLGLGYAEAFRGKEIGDGFTFGDSPFGGSMVDDLDGESVSNIEASAEYTGQDLRVKFAVFESEIDDVIFDQNYGAVTYDNIGTVESDGFEIEVAYSWNDIDLFLGYSHVNATLNPADGFYTQDFDSVDINAYKFRGLGTNRGDTWNLGLNYSPMASVRTGITVTYVEDLKLDTLYQDFDLGWLPSTYELEKDSYTTVDLFAEWDVSPNLVLNLAVINLFDKQYRDHSSVGDYSEVPGYGVVAGPWEAGRDIRLSASYSF